MALGIGYGLPFLPHFGSGADPYKPLWNEALEGAKAAGATVEDEGGTCLVARGSEEYNAGLPNTPSLLIVPQFYKDGNLYQDVPPFVAEDSTMRFTVSRNTTATRVNSSGLIESVASGVPRIDWLGQSCPALLVEPSATNLVPSGTNVGGEAGVSRTATTTSPAVDISGTIIAKTVTGTTNLFASQTCLTSLPSGSTTYTISRFFKYNGTDLTTSLENNNSTQWGGTAWNQRVVISAASGVTLGTSTSCTGSVENYGNGWYRVSARFTTGATPSGAASVSYLMLVSGSLASGSSFLTALPQLETGSVATTYIPTTSGAVSRAADVISASGALVSGLIGQTEGTIYAEVDVRTLGAAKNILQIDDGTATNRIGLFVDISPTRLTLLMSSGGSTSSISGSVTTGITKIAASYSSGNMQVFTNGSFLVSGTIAYPTTTLNDISVGSRISGGIYGLHFNDRIRSAALYTTRLSNAQLAELTRL